MPENKPMAVSTGKKDITLKVFIEEAEKLGQDGWTKYDEINGVHLYRRLKP